jgi:hypothetical protein
MVAYPGILHGVISLAKYAAFFKISFSIRSRLISFRSCCISSAVEPVFSVEDNSPLWRYLLNHSQTDQADGSRRSATSAYHYRLLGHQAGRL